VVAITVVDAGTWAHRWGAGNKEDAYWFPNDCAALNPFGACHPFHNIPTPNKHVTDWVSFNGCPHSHWGFRNGWKRYHTVRFAEAFKKGHRRSRNKMIGHMNDFEVLEIVCAGHFVNAKFSEEQVIFPGGDNDNKLVAANAPAVLDDKKPFKGKDIVGQPISYDAQKKVYFFDKGPCTPDEITKALHLFNVVTVPNQDRVEFTPKLAEFKKLMQSIYDEAGKEVKVENDVSTPEPNPPPANPPNPAVAPVVPPAAPPAPPAAPGANQAQAPAKK
jgi:hypothetical protein